jgi:cytochrome b561
MSDNGVSQAYSPAAKGLHWLIVLLVGVQFVTAYLLPHIRGDTPPSTVVNLHFSLGILILLVMALRLIHRLMYPVVLEARDATAWERILAKATHRVFYLILLVAPVLGWASASAHRLPVNLFGLVTLPAIAAPGAHWANIAGDIHGTVMWALLWLVGLHASAALFHHVVRRDGTLRRMLPMPERWG